MRCTEEPEVARGLEGRHPNGWLVLGHRCELTFPCYTSFEEEEPGPGPALMASLLFGPPQRGSGMHDWPEHLEVLGVGRALGGHLGLLPLAFEFLQKEIVHKMNKKKKVTTWGKWRSGVLIVQRHMESRRTLSSPLWGPWLLCTVPISLGADSPVVTERIFLTDGTTSKRNDSSCPLPQLLGTFHISCSCRQKCRPLQMLSDKCSK